jgi:hypothetical protein
MGTENATQEHTLAEEEEAIIKNWQSDDSDSDRSYQPRGQTQSLIREEGCSERFR